MNTTKQKAIDVLEDYANSYSQVDVERLTRYLEQIKSEAIKEFTERLCTNRVSNDPVVIAVQCELKEMEGELE